MKINEFNPGLCKSTEPPTEPKAAADMDNLLLHIYWAIERGKMEEAKKHIQTRAVEPAVKELLEVLTEVVAIYGDVRIKDEIDYFSLQPARSLLSKYGVET